ILPNGHIYFRNVPLRKIVAAAYNIDEDLVTGGPEWINSDRFNVVAKAAPTTSQPERRAMLQALLAERFKLTIHHKPKPDPVYVLSLGKNGTGLQPSAKPGL